MSDDAACILVAPAVLPGLACYYNSICQPRWGAAAVVVACERDTPVRDDETTTPVPLCAKQCDRQDIKIQDTYLQGSPSGFG